MRWQGLGRVRPVGHLALAAWLVAPLGWSSRVAVAQAGGASVLKQHYDQAQHAQAAGSFVEAARQYRIFIADALAELALEAVTAGAYPKAAPLFDEALALAPNSPGLKIRYAQAALAAGDAARTRTLAEGVLRDFPDNTKADAKAQLLLGRALSRMNQEQEARQHFEAAVALDPSFEDGYALAIACLDLNDGEGADRIFHEMIAGLGDTAPLRVEIGRAYLNSDFQQKAAPEFERAIALDPKLPGAHYSLAVAELTAGGDDRLKQARVELEAELKLSPNDAATHAQLGNIALQEHRPADAERELKQAEALDPTDPNGSFYLGQLYAEMGRTPEAIAAFERTIALTKDPAYNRYQVQKAHYQLGRLLLQTGKQDDGRREMQLAGELLKRSLGKDRERLAGELEDKAGAADATPVTAPETPARAGASAALEADEKRLAPAVADSYNNLGVIAAQAEHPDEALSAFARAYEWNPRLPALDENWGLAALRARRFGEAVPPFERALRAAPANAAVRGELADAHAGLAAEARRAGRAAEAEREEKLAASLRAASNEGAVPR